MKNKIEIIKLLTENGASKDRANEIILHLNSIYNEEARNTFYNKLKKNPKNYEKILDELDDKRHEDWKKERKAEVEYIKNNYPKDSQEYLDCLIEQYVFRDLILNSIAYYILKTREKGLLLVNWLEKNDKKITEQQFIKKCLEIALNDKDYKTREFDDKDKKLIEIIREKDNEKLLTEDEIKFFITQTNIEDYSRDYLYDSLTSKSFDEMPSNKHFKHYVMTLLCNPQYILFNEDRKLDDEEKEDYEIAKKNCETKLKEYVSKKILTDEDVDDIYSRLFFRRKYQNLYEFIILNEENNVELTKEDILFYVKKIGLGLCDTNYELLNKLDLSSSLNSKSDKKRLSRFINDKYGHIFVGNDYNYINTDSTMLQMCQVLYNNSVYSDYESIDNTIFGLTNSYTWKPYMASDIKNGQYAYFTEDDKVTNYDYFIPVHIMNDEINKECKNGNSFEMQISSIALDIVKLDNENENVIFYNDCIPKLNTLVSNECSKFYKDNGDLGLLKGTIKRIRKYQIELFDKNSIINEIVVDTQFGELPIYYHEKDYQDLKEKDFIEAIVYITGDALLSYKNIKNELNIKNNYQFMKLAFEKNNMNILAEVLSEKVELLFEDEIIKGKNDVINKLNDFINSKSKKYCGMYPTVITKEGKNKEIKVGDEVLTISFSEEFSPYGQFKIKLNKEGLINKIIYIDDSTLKARRIKGFAKTNKILTREQLSKKYVNSPIPKMENPTEEDYVFYYKTHIKILEELREDLYEIHRRPIKEECELNEKQKLCKEKCYIKDNGWHEEYQQYRQSFYEMIDFIYHPGFKEDYVDKYLSTIEVTEVLDLLEFLIDTAEKLIKIHKSKKEN